MYTELLFRKKGSGRIHAEDARKLVASACDGFPVDPRVFNRGDDQKTIGLRYGDDRNGEGFGVPPRIVFDGGLDFLRIYGIGKQGSLLVDEAMPILFAALYRQGFIGADRKDGQMSLSSDMERMRLYSIRRLVVAKRPDACAGFVRKPVQDVSEIVSGIILRGLTGMARMLDEELAADGHPRRYEAEIPYRIDVLEGEPVPIPIKSGVLAAAYKNMVIAMPTKLSGPWSAGMLRSRGYGFVRLNNPTAEG